MSTALNGTESNGLVLDVDEESKQPIIIVDAELTQKLKVHQKKGVEFMWNTCYETVKQLQEHPGYGCILAHCMGLGKTLQVIFSHVFLFGLKCENTVLYSYFITLLFNCLIVSISS